MCILTILYVTEKYSLHTCKSEIFNAYNPVNASPDMQACN